MRHSHILSNPNTLILTPHTPTHSTSYPDEIGPEPSTPGPLHAPPPTPQEPEQGLEGTGHAAAPAQAVSAAGTVAEKEAEAAQAPLPDSDEVQACSVRHELCPTFHDCRHDRFTHVAKKEARSERAETKSRETEPAQAVSACTKVSTIVLDLWK